MKGLDRDELLRLMKFVCSFAWTDLAIADQERRLVERMVSAEVLSDADRRQVAGWLRVPPPIEEVDPTQIPVEHRQLFIDAVRAVVAIDGQVSDVERDSIAIFEELVRTAD